jgi:phosphotransferase system HPr (HPr) family protein
LKEELNMEKRRVFCIPKDGFKGQKLIELVQFSSSFEGDVYIEKNNKIINAKSILGVLSLLMPSKTGMFMISVQGEDAEYTIQQITTIIEKQMTTRSNLPLWGSGWY